MPKTVKWDAANILRIGKELICFNNEDEIKDSLRKKIEPWLTSIMQSEHLSLLLGTGLPIAMSGLTETTSQGMSRISFGKYGVQIKAWADKSAKKMGRGEANLEDDIRSALELLRGFEIMQNEDEYKALRHDFDSQMASFSKGILGAEHKFINSAKCEYALRYLKAFLVSFASRTATRERLNIFTTNYDRFIELGCDLAGIIIVDRFIGKIKPLFRTSRLELDYHYNPPGIRGEPRYVEGVVRLTKLHGSIDWQFEDDYVSKMPLPFGAPKEMINMLENNSERLVIYPNSHKAIETAYYPYSELFRDMASAVCRPNSSIVTYGYGFGDSHINRILQDMLSIPSTHLVIISYDGASGRIRDFEEKNNPDQITLLIGNHFGNIATLAENYLPKSAIDRITERMQRNLEKRGEGRGTEPVNSPNKADGGDQDNA